MHGQGAERFELLRTVDALRELGHPTLLIQYRNDPGAPATGDSLVLREDAAQRTPSTPGPSSDGEGPRGLPGSGSDGPQQAPPVVDPVTRAATHQYDLHGVGRAA